MSAGRCRVIHPEVRCIEVAAGILWRGDRFLAACRPPGSVQEGFWEFPGGKIEHGESPAEAMARELTEELGSGLGVTAQHCHFWRLVEHEYAEPPRRVRLHFFHVRGFSGEPRPREGQDLRWVTPQEAQELNFLAADVAVLRELCADAFHHAER